MAATRPQSTVASLARLRRLSPWAAAIAVAVSLVYLPVLVELVRDWVRDPNYQHGFLIVPISAYFVWKARSRFRRDIAGSATLLGAVGIVAAAGLLVVGTAGAEVFTQRVSLVLLLGALVLYLRGWHDTKIAAFPIALLLLAIPLPYVIYYALTTPMQALAAKAAVWGLRALGVQSLLQGNIIHLPGGSLEVAEACSGIRSLYAFLAAGALIAHSTAVSGWAKALIFLSALPIAVAGNAVRVWGSGLGVWLIGPSAAEGLVHELFGVVVFVISLAVFLIVRTITRRLWSSAT